MSNVQKVDFGHATMRTKPQEGLVYRGFDEFREHDYPPRELVLAPWLPAKGLAMVAGYRGTGKTYFGLAIAYAIATGGSVLGWPAEKPRKVIYIDGEMPPEDLQERVEAIHRAAVADRNGKPELASQNFFMLCGEDQRGGNGMPDLAGDDSAGREQVETALEETGAEVLILDNLSCLFRHSGESENTAESWIGTQEWLVSLRRKGKTVLFFHHTGKPDAETGKTRQRGTSKREDVLNTSILLTPIPHRPTGFCVEWSKTRGFIPPAEIYARIEHEKGECRLVASAKNDRAEEARARYAAGETQAAIAKALSVDQGTVSRWCEGVGRGSAAGVL